MIPKLSVNIGKLKLKNPVMVASGTFGDRPQVIVMIVLTVVLTLIVLLPLSVILGRRASRQEIAAQ